MNIAQFLDPKSIAIYGVSEDPKKVGSQIYFNIIHNNFKGQVFPINPNYDSVHNVKCYKNIIELASLTREGVTESVTGGLKIDLAIIVTPSQTIPQILEEIGQTQTKNVVIISAGFKEIGKAGIELENKVLELASKYGLNILGPNCLGFINNISNLNATFSSIQPRLGNVAFVSQSGAVGTSFMDVCEERGLGLSYFVSLGNKVGINENNLLEFLLRDQKTEVIAFYLEDFEKGLDFIQIIENYSRNGKLIKPIVLIHPGSSEQAKSAVSSHTGSLAKPWDIIETALQKYGVITISNIESFINVITLLSWNLNNFLSFENKSQNIDNVANKKSLNFTVLTNAGGPGIILTDLLSHNGFNLDKLSDKTLSKLNNSEVLKNKGCSFANPIDIVGDAKVDRYKESLEIILNDQGIKNVIIILTPQSSTEIKETAELIINLKSKFKSKLIIPLFAGGIHIKQARDEFYKNRIMNFKYDDDLIDTLIALKNWGNNKYILNVPNLASEANLNTVKLTEGILSESEVLKLCEDYKISIPKTFLFDNVDKLNVSIDQVDFPVILKATSKDVLHKTENKLVEIATNRIELQSKFVEMQNKIQKIKLLDEKNSGNLVINFDNYYPDILIQKMLPKSLELFVGVKRDGDSEVYQSKFGFGHMLIFGTGGIYTEIYNDLSKVILPIDLLEIETMINKTKVGKVLNGARGKVFAKEKLINLLLHLQNLVFDHPEISEVDINPIMISENYAQVVDMKVIVKN
ncbi:acetate--CoA ligase family protein [bacterium]|nr:MAG: acetate--CoA ligase family protein [bacterium]